MDPFLECTMTKNLPNCSSDVYANMPDDCLLNIFHRLQNTSDRNAFGLTCRCWFRIQSLTRRALVFHLSYSPDVDQTYARYLPRILARFPYLSSISLAGCAELPLLTLLHLRRSGSCLRFLSLYFCYGLTDDGLALVCAGCTQLVSITLYRCNITDTGLESLATSCQALESVNLSFCLMISDRGIKALVTGCLKLRGLMISFCKGITGTGFQECSPSLTFLEADSCMFTPEGVSDVVSGGGLEYLNIANMRCWVEEDGLKGIGSGLATRLRFLNLRLCRFAGDDSVVAIAKNCPLLEEWSLAVCHDVRLSGWRAIASDCRNLKVLHVNRCRNLCDRGLEALRNGCIRLRVLYMHGCRRVTVTGFEAFKLRRHDVEVKGEECVSIGPCIDNLFA